MVQHSNGEVGHSLAGIWETTTAKTANSTAKESVHILCFVFAGRRAFKIVSVIA